VAFSPQTTITDTIPDGLTIVPSTITGTQSATPAAGAITWQRSGQTITWSVPNTMLPADVSVSVTVGAISSTLPVGTIFENTAQVRSTSTNTTYHKLTKAPVAVKHKVTYVDYDGTVLSTQEVADGANATPPKDPTRLGYTFTGWDSDGKDITKDTVITALYTPISDRGGKETTQTPGGNQSGNKTTPTVRSTKGGTKTATPAASSDLPRTGDVAFNASLITVLALMTTGTAALSAHRRRKMAALLRRDRVADTG